MEKNKNTKNDVRLKMDFWEFGLVFFFWNKMIFFYVKLENCSI